MRQWQAGAVGSRSAGAARGGRLAAVAALGWLALAGAVAGCGSDIIEPGFEIEGRRMVIIPFRDAVQHHYLSPRGNRLTQALARSLEGYHLDEPDDAIAVVPFEEVVEAVGREDPTRIAHADMAKRVRADCFLVGALTRFDTRLSGDLGVIRGRAEIALQVLETERPTGRPLLERRVSVSFPPDSLTSAGVLSPTEATEQDIETGLTAAMIDKLGKLFRYHEPEEQH